MSKRDFLFEIGTEELPPKSLFTLAQALADGVAQGLDGGCDHARRGRMVRDAAPPGGARRTASPISSRTRRSNARARRSPMRSTPTAQPTKAALGFAASCGVSVEAAAAGRWTEGPRAACSSARSKGEPTAALLPGIVNGGARRAADREAHALGRGRAGVRPSRALGRDAVRHERRRCEILGVRPGKHSRGHRFHAPQPLRDREPGEVSSKLLREGSRRRRRRRAPRAHPQRSDRARRSAIGGHAVIEDGAAR